MHARREHGTLLRRPPPALGLGDRDVPLHQCEVLVDAALVLRLAKARVHLRGIRALRRRSSPCGALGLAAAWVLNSGQYGAAGVHGTRHVRYGRGWYACPVRTVRGALGASRPAPPVRTQRGRLVRVARTYPTEAPGRTCQLRRRPSLCFVPTSTSARPKHSCTLVSLIPCGARRRPPGRSCTAPSTNV
jgi:hypothetical protein